MNGEHKMAEIMILYPPLKGCILEAYNLQQQLITSFGLSVGLEVQIEKCFTLILKGKTIYSAPIEDKFHINHKKIIKSVSKYRTPLEQCSEEPPEASDIDDEDHLRWMNSVCSGE